MSQEEFTRCGSGEHEQRHACALRHRPIAFIELITATAVDSASAAVVMSSMKAMGRCLSAQA